MQLSITYEELKSYLFNHYKTDIGISSIDEKTVCVSYKYAPFLPGAKINITIETISDADITLSYNGGIVGDIILKKIVLFVKERLSEQVSFSEQDCAIIHLAKIKDLDKVFNSLRLKDISFDTEKVNLYLEFNNISTDCLYTILGYKLSYHTIEN